MAGLSSATRQLTPYFWDIAAPLGAGDPYHDTAAGLGANVLGAVNYTVADAAPRLRSGFPELSLHMARSTRESFAEVWLTDAPVEVGQRGGVAYAYDGDHVFCAGRIEPTGNYTRSTRTAYLAAFDILAELGCTSVFRMWNFIGRINEENAEGLEIYRDFCRGRAEAFRECALTGEQSPAATGIGSRGEGIGFYMLGRRSGGHANIENSRQISAFNYPPRYGPKSPKFARATLLKSRDLGERGRIYVSGTASILGHESRHEDDVDAQCELALRNISHLVGPENLTRYGVAGRSILDLRNIKVYVRRDEDMPLVRKRCEAVFAPEAEVAYLNVDVCRRELLVEIEGIAF